jgi:cytochrome c5
MDAGNMGYGAGGGLLAAVLTFVGFKQRLDRTDKDVADLKSSVVYKDTCGVCHAATQRAVDGIDKKLDVIIERLK